MMQRRRRPGGTRKPRASTQDIVGQFTRPDRVPNKWRNHYNRLLQLRDQLAGRQNDLTADVLEQRPAFSTHMADAGTDTFDRDLALGLLSSEQDALYQIEQALDRIRNGSYGICELTGKPIEPLRLDAIPWTRFSAAAEKQLEAEGVRKRARLGPRDSIPRTSEASEAEEPA